jgi:hypothetical protein
VISHLAAFHTNQVLVSQVTAQQNVMMVVHSQNSLRLLTTQMFVQVKTQLRMLFIHMVTFKLLSQFTLISKFTHQVSMNTHGDHTWVDTLLHLLVMVKKTVLPTGRYKTVGVNHGVKTVASELSEVLMNVVLKIHATKVTTDSD